MFVNPQAEKPYSLEKVKYAFFKITRWLFDQPRKRTTNIGEYSTNRQERDRNQNTGLNVDLFRPSRVYLSFVLLQTL
ncbi:MAG TPA: hypothetical protein DCE41_00185 [Cytophagales bacterium]|nr:hypothetical protein [Cytophagales bacterium]HAA18846.1 hypothetical protein [Cytophagales bacterium]HAP60877.1 hypothetical protein [Cytophagales bacterium]